MKFRAIPLLAAASFFATSSYAEKDAMFPMLHRCFEHIVTGTAEKTEGLEEVSYEALGMQQEEWQAIGRPRYFFAPNQSAILIISTPFGSVNCLATTGLPGRPSPDEFRALTVSFGLEIPSECDGYREEGIDGNIRAISFDQNSKGAYPSARYFVSPQDGLTWVLLREHEFPASSACNREYLRDQ